MASRSKRPCKHIGCRELVEQGYCEKHKKDDRSYDRYRGSSTERGYNGKWRRYREQYLKDNPLCVECSKRKKATPATVVDHIIDHKGNEKLFWDISNHQALCKRHHDSKTARTNPRGRA